jgi:hypothetical protein
LYFVVRENVFAILVCWQTSGQSPNSRPMWFSCLTVICSSELLAICVHRFSNASCQALAGVAVSKSSLITEQCRHVRITSESGIAVEVLNSIVRPNYSGHAADDIHQPRGPAPRPKGLVQVDRCWGIRAVFPSGRLLLGDSRIHAVLNCRLHEEPTRSLW